MIRLLTSAAVALFPMFVFGRLLISPEKAMQATWPQATIRKESILLTPAQRDQARKRAGLPITENVYTFFRAEKSGRDVGYGALITSRVRTKDETSLYLISPDGRLEGIEIVAFYEPPEYMPLKTWLAQFKNKILNDPIRARQDIPLISGATLTSQAFTKAARIALAVWSVNFASSAPTPAPTPISESIATSPESRQ